MRGNNREAIYFTDDDRQMFLMTLATVRSRFRWRVHAFCLLSNHYHLLVETREANLAVGMQVLNSSYSHITNQTHGRVGHLFQRRYGSQLLADEDHLMEVIRYIPLNPGGQSSAIGRRIGHGRAIRRMLGAGSDSEVSDSRLDARRFAGRGGREDYVRGSIGHSRAATRTGEQPLDVAPAARSSRICD